MSCRMTSYSWMCHLSSSVGSHSGSNTHCHHHDATQCYIARLLFVSRPMATYHGCIVNLTFVDFWCWKCKYVHVGCFELWNRTTKWMSLCCSQVWGRGHTRIHQLWQRVIGCHSRICFRIWVSSHQGLCFCSMGSSFCNSACDSKLGLSLRISTGWDQHKCPACYRNQFLWHWYNLSHWYSQFSPLWWCNTHLAQYYHRPLCQGMLS